MWFCRTGGFQTARCYNSIIYIFGNNWHGQYRYCYPLDCNADMIFLPANIKLFIIFLIFLINYKYLQSKDQNNGISLRQLIMQ